MLGTKKAAWFFFSSDASCRLADPKRRGNSPKKPVRMASHRGGRPTTCVVASSSSISLLTVNLRWGCFPPLQSTTSVAQSSGLWRLSGELQRFVMRDATTRSVREGSSLMDLAFKSSVCWHWYVRGTGDVIIIHWFCSLSGTHYAKHTKLSVLGVVTLNWWLVNIFQFFFKLD